jgi:hypothetical protein
VKATSHWFHDIYEEINYLAESSDSHEKKIQKNVLKSDSNVIFSEVDSLTSPKDSLSQTFKQQF